MDFAAVGGICKLGERRKSFLQVLLSEFILTKEGDGLTLGLSIHDELDSIADPDARQRFFAAVRRDGLEPQERLLEALRAFRDDPRALAYRFPCSDWPLRYANGGVLPVVRLDDEEHFVFFYRETDPIGWNIANGGSDDIEELLDPGQIILREFGEELFVLDHVKRILYAFSPADVDLPAGYQERALERLSASHPDWELPSYERLPIPLRWIDGPDRTHVKTKDRECRSDGFFLNLVPEDSSIEVDRVALINLKGNVVFFDGEQSRGTLFNRPVGLFRVEDVERSLERHETDFRPAG